MNKLFEHLLVFLRITMTQSRLPGSLLLFFSLKRGRGGGGGSWRSHGIDIVYHCCNPMYEMLEALKACFMCFWDTCVHLSFCLQIDVCIIFYFFYFLVCLFRWLDFMWSFGFYFHLQ